MKYIVIDIETTGLNPAFNEIIEIGAIKVNNNQIIEEFSSLIKPRLLISQEITNLTGITNDMVENAENEATVLQEFLAFSKDCDLFIGHNIDDFDLPFINKRLLVNGLNDINKETIDTLKLARGKISYKLIQNHRLDTVAKFFNVTGYGSHRALEDVKKTWEIYKKLTTYEGNAEKCPKCGNVLRKMNGRFGAFLGCSGYPNCRFTKNF